MNKIDFKNELVKNVENGILVAFMSESLSDPELKAFEVEHKEFIENESIDFESDESDYFEHVFKNDTFDVVYLKYKKVYLFGCYITMHLLNEEFFQSESTIIYQVEKV